MSKIFKRKIYNDLLKWKQTHQKDCLIVKGARQVGKTYIIDYFGRNEYKNYVYINFYENNELIKIFDGSLAANDLYSKMSLYLDGFKLVENETLIFLDEIQFCPNARTALKFLAIDGRADVIASGSLLGLHYKEIASIPVGYESQINMYSMDFEEFLWANGVTDENLEILKNYYTSGKKVDDVINNKYLDYINDYLVVGGMPEVILKFLEQKNYQEVNKCQETILNSYRDDILKYASNVEKNKILACFDSIPNQLAKDYTKFQYKTIEKNGNSKKYAESIYWLIDAGLVKQCFNVKVPEIPLVAFKELENFKLYMLDIGLLTCMYGMDTQLTLKRNGINNTGKGGIFENLVFDVLIKMGFNLYYYKNDKNTQEIEFIYEYDGEVVPLEVKAKNGKTVSLNNFIDKYNPKKAYKIIYGNVGVKGNLKIIPYYMLLYIKPM